MIVMPANNFGAIKLYEKYPGKIGWLFGPSGWKTPRDFPYALENDRYSAWSKGKHWSEHDWRKLIDKALAALFNPLWISMPDVVCDAVATFEEWNRRYCQVPSGWRKALVVQDGMTPDSVRFQCETQPDVIFVGGSREWKIRTLWNWCQEFPWVHVGRINSEKDLWRCHAAGVKSCDGTGWFRGDQAQLRGLLRYLRISHAGMRPAQLEWEFSSTFVTSEPE